MTQPSPQVDTALLLHDGAAAVTADGNGQSGGSDTSIDMGAAADMSGVMYIECSAFDTTTGDETVDVSLVGSNQSDFSSDLQEVAVLRMGDATQLIGDADVGVGRHVIPFLGSAINGNTFRYWRVQFDVSGTTPSYTGIIYMSPNDL